LAQTPLDIALVTHHCPCLVVLGWSVSNMDPQLQEYRRKQREKAAATAVDAQKTGRQNQFFAFGAGVVLVMAMLAAVSLQQAPKGALGTVSHAAGVCPKANGPGVCVEECSRDAQCQAEGKLCCSNGCGHVCMTPVDPNAPPPARPCTLMIVPVSINDSTKLITQVPKPESHTVLRGVKILLLNYGKGRDADCCRAQEQLSAAKNVKSVEYDGPPPTCSSLVMPLQTPARPPQPKVTPAEPGVMGGWSNEEKVDDEDLMVWNQLVDETPRHEEVELGALGAPVTVRKQVVAGVKYKFKFSDGSVVEVFSQPWTKTLEVTNVESGSGGR